MRHFASLPSTPPEGEGVASSEAKSFVDMGLHAEPDTAEGNMGAGETILVVEDDGQVHSYVVVLPSSAR